MDDMEEKLSSILSNPQMMSQIMNLAQTLGKQPEEPKQEGTNKASASTQSTFSFPNNLDTGMLQKLAGIAQQSGIDRNQQTLLKALSPYLSKERIIKLEKAMRAAKMAALASTLFGGNSQFFLGR